MDRNTHELDVRVEDLIKASEEAGELTIEELDTVSGAGVSVSSLACIACPISSFSSAANGNC
jgi:hypothetical protein